MKRRLPIVGVALQIALLRGFPALFHRVQGGVEDEAVRMEVWGDFTLDGPRREVDKFGADEIAGDPVLVLPAATHARFHFCLGVLERFMIALPERSEDAFVARDFV